MAIASSAKRIGISSTIGYNTWPSARISPPSIGFSKPTSGGAGQFSGGNRAVDPFDQEGLCRLQPRMVLGTNQEFQRQTILHDTTNLTIDNMLTRFA